MKEDPSNAAIFISSVFTTELSPALYLSKMQTNMLLGWEKMMEKNKENTDQQLDLAKDLIMTFIAEEYEEELRPFDYLDLGHIGVAYATTEDEEHEIQIEISLIDYSINQYIDGELGHCKKI